jgi:hypothetical protein
MIAISDIVSEISPMVERVGAIYGCNPLVHSFPFDEVYVYVFNRRITLVSRRDLDEERLEMIMRLAEARLVDAYERRRIRANK